MAGVQDSALTIAVSNAGGLGSLPCGMLTKATLEQELRTISVATTKPYHLNFFCHHIPNYDLLRHREWLRQLLPSFNELGGQCISNPTASVRQPFSAEVAEAIEPFKPPVLSFHFGQPEQALLKCVQSWGQCYPCHSYNGGGSIMVRATGDRWNHRAGKGGWWTSWDVSYRRS